MNLTDARGVPCDRCDTTENVWYIGRRGWKLCPPCLAFVVRTIQQGAHQ